MTKQARKLNWVLVAVVVMPTAALGADAKKVFEPHVFDGPGGAKLPYRLMQPKDYNLKQKYPLVLFFHGAGERCGDNLIQLVHGMSDFAKDENREKYPCFVVAPQCPEKKRWVEVDWTADAHDFDDKPLYTEYEGVAHDSWVAAYRDPKLMEWLFAQKRSD